MGLINIIPQDTLPENPGVNQLLDSETGAMSIVAGVISLGSTPVVVTYTSTAGSIPSDQVIFDLWAPVVGAANGASGPAVVAPIIVDTNNDILYPTIA